MKVPYTEKPSLTRKIVLVFMVCIFDEILRGLKISALKQLKNRDEINKQ